MRKLLCFFLCFFSTYQVFASCELGDFLMVKSRPDRAIKEYANCGDLYGDIESLTKVGDMYYKGVGLSSNYQKALSYYTKSANMGYSKAQVRLGLLYWRGEGTDVDLRRAYMWLFLANEDSEKKWYYPISMAYEQNVPIGASEGAMAYFDSLKRKIAGTEGEKNIINGAMKDANEWKYRRLNEFAKKVLRADEYENFVKNLKQNAKDAKKVSEILASLRKKGQEVRLIK